MFYLVQATTRMVSIALLFAYFEWFTTILVSIQFVSNMALAIVTGVRKDVNGLVRYSATSIITPFVVAVDPGW